MNDRQTPVPEDKFAFGLWTIGHPGRDPFGDSTRPPISTADFVRGLADIGAWGVSFHDDDLMTFGAPESERRAELDAFKKVLDETGVVCSMATTNLFWHPLFKDGAFTSNDREVRRYAIQKTLRNIDVAAELGAPTYVLWGGREGVESAASKNPADALDRYKEAMDFLCGYVKEKKYNIRFAMEPKPNEPRGDTFLPTIGHTMAFINTLEYPDMVGLNPEVAHETMAGLSFFQGVAQALWQEKLYHIDLNDQKIGRFDQDLCFGSEGIKDAMRAKDRERLSALRDIGDIDDVDITQVIELRRSGLAHADDGQWYILGAQIVVFAGDIERSVERGVVDVDQSFGHPVSIYQVVDGIY